MDRNRFFRLVWRFNSVAIMLATIVAISVLGVIAYMTLHEITGRRSMRNVVNVDGPQQVTDKWEFGQMSAIRGTSYVTIPLYSDQTYTQSHYSKEAKATRNILFIDAPGSDRHWLFDANDYLIAEHRLITEGSIHKEGSIVKAILYSVVKKDTNGDKRLTTKDQKDIALSAPNGRNYKEILKGIDSLLGHELVNRDTILLLYQKQGIAYSASVGLSDFSIMSQSELPKIKKGP
jgi:hypothetical protein